MSHWTQIGKQRLFSGLLDFRNGGTDFRVLLCMSNTTADTEKAKDNLAAYTNLDEHDDGSYARQSLTSELLYRDDTAIRVEFQAANAVFPLLDAGSRQVVGALVYEYVDGTNANDIPIAWVDQGTGFPFDGQGANVTIQWNTEGILQGTDAP